MEVMKSVKIVLIAGAVLVLAGGGIMLKTLRDAGEFKEIVPHFVGECKAISGVLSSEDITVLQKTGMAFISSADRRPLFQGNQGQQGAIYAFDLTAENPRLMNLTPDFTQEFHPHGMGLFTAQDGRSSLFVVNHRQDDHFVEIFDYRQDKLVHRDSIRGALMHSPNDVVPVGPRSFYVTNDHGNSSELGRTLEEYLQLARSYVLYYDGSDFRVVAEGLAYANGINISRDGKTLYVAATVGGKIYVYDRELDSGTLNLRDTVDLETGVDNIEVDDTGILWVGAHPKLLTYVAYSKDPQKLSPSQVLRVDIQETGSATVDEIFLDKGDALSGSSVAAVFKDRLLIGSVLDNRFLLCNVNQ
jgi:arylesterase/paraoxonase